jgi:hypothetical protein
LGLITVNQLDAASGRACHSHNLLTNNRRGKQRSPVTAIDDRAPVPGDSDLPRPDVGTPDKTGS